MNLKLRNLVLVKPMRAESKRIAFVDRHLAVTDLCIDNFCDERLTCPRQLSTGADRTGNSQM